jgi:peptide-methionine (S)-S-oxide reductase
MNKLATFGAGCFWGVEAAYRKLDGVVDVASGYAGGHKPDPNYAEVCSGTTGHTEVVQVEYDPERVSYQQLLDLFWTLHDPTSPEKAQYRSVIFTHADEQQVAAEDAVRQRKAENNRRPIQTSVEPAPTFYRAEEYHQQYLAKHGVA